MAKVYMFLAAGFEEIEAITAVDMLRRASIEVCTVSITGELTVTGTHGVPIVADQRFEEMDASDGDLLLLPGGQPGTTNLSAYQPLAQLLNQWNREGKNLAAICAAPTVFGQLGILRGKDAACYPGCEDQLEGANVLMQRVVTDRNITTSRGVGTAISFSLALIRILQDAKVADEIQASILYGH